MKKIKNFQIKTELWYDTEKGLWLDIHKNMARIGMSPLVQETSGSFVAIRLSTNGETLTRGSSFGSVEAEKHVGHLNAPVSGTVVAVNPEVSENPRLINDDPYGKGWLIEIEMTNFLNEHENLLSGQTNVGRWFEEEITKYEEKGWLATP